MAKSAQSTSPAKADFSLRNIEAEVQAALAEVETLDKPALVERYEALYGGTRPSHVRRKFLIQAIAHRIQENAYGGLSKATQRRLKSLAKELRETGQLKSITSPQYKPGTRLLREWQGETHVVTVTHDGYLYQGTHYQSLSLIARTITGTQWSGPAFFGLKRKQPPE